MRSVESPDAVVDALRTQVDALVRQLAALDQANVTLSGQNTDLAERLALAERALEARSGFWTDPEYLNRNKDCTGPGCQGTGFLRNVPGPNELPCPVCRPIAASASRP